MSFAGCLDEEDDPLGSGMNYVDAGNGGGTFGGNGGSLAGNGGTSGGNGGSLAGNGGGSLGGSGAADSSVGVPSGTGGGTTGQGAGFDAGGAVPGGGGLGDAGAGAASDAGSGSSDGATPSPDAAADAGATGGDAGAAPHADLGKGNGSDVLMIGDSWMSLGSANSGIQGGILKASGQPYRAEGIGGTTLLGGGILDVLFAAIPVQWEQAVRANPDVKTVIMTAGGNDILQTGLEDDCKMEGDACAEQVTKVLTALSKLWADMASKGVKDIVYILYATPEGKSVDFLLPDGDGARKRCANVPAPTRCHIVETLDIVMGDIPDGIHPSQTASDRIGKAVVDLMAAQGMRR